MTVLVDVPGPGWSRAAIREAAQQARFRGTKLVAVAAYRAEHSTTGPAGRPATGMPSESADRDAAESVLQSAALDALGPDAGQVELRVMQGPPGRSLIEAARALGAELLVIASRGDGAMSWLLGSQYVLRNAPCPVLMVPDPMLVG
jgi:nucleotide-binding universal stress UspA family protein